jgi:hypothetical protein
MIRMRTIGHGLPDGELGVGVGVGVVVVVVVVGVVVGVVVVGVGVVVGVLDGELVGDDGEVEPGVPEGLGVLGVFGVVLGGRR